MSLTPYPGWERIASIATAYCLLILGICIYGLGALSGEILIDAIVTSVSLSTLMYIFYHLIRPLRRSMRSTLRSAIKWATNTTRRIWLYHRLDDALKIGRFTLGFAVVLLAFVVYGGGTGVGAVDNTVNDVWEGAPADKSYDLPEASDVSEPSNTQGNSESDGMQGPAGVGSSTTPGQETASDDSEGRSGEIDKEELAKLVHKQVNEVRSDEGLSTLEFDSELAAIAEDHSADMAERDYFSHHSPEGHGFAYRYDQAGYDCRVSTGGNRYLTGAENLYQMEYEGISYSEDEIAERTVEGWMQSPGHRENMLKADWRREGIGVAITERDGETAVYVTQNFC